MKGIAVAVLMVVLSLVLFACSNQSPPLPGGSTTAIRGAQFDRAGQAMTLTVYVHRDIEGVNEALEEHARKSGTRHPHEGKKVSGWALWSEQDMACDIHVVMIRSANDSDSLSTAGHELAHCLYG